MLPILDMLTGEEVEHALVKAILTRRNILGKEADALLKTAEARVTYKNVKFPDGNTYMFATVGIFRRDQSPTETPVQEVSNG